MRIEMSPEITEIAAALVKAQGAIKPAEKDATNPHFKHKYADLSSIVEACRQSLVMNGLAVVQSASADGDSVTVSTMLVHSSGQWIGGELTMKARDASPQSIGSAITYGRRYQLAAIVGVAPDDDDGETAHPKRNGNRTEQTKAQPAAAVGSHLTDARITTAKAIANAGFVERDFAGFKVKSLDSKSTFNVWRNDEGRVCCDCAEFKATAEVNAQFRCEHILAIKFHLEPPSDHLQPPSDAPSPTSNPTGNRAATDAEMITPAQIRAIQAFGRAKAIDVEMKCRERYDCDVAELSRTAATDYLAWLEIQQPVSDRERTRETITQRMNDLTIAEHPGFVHLVDGKPKPDKARIVAWLKRKAAEKWSIQIKPETITGFDSLPDDLFAEVPALLQAELDELIESRNQHQQSKAASADDGIPF